MKANTRRLVSEGRVAEELPLPGGPRGTNTNPYTLKTTRRAARKQRPHFLLTDVCINTFKHVTGQLKSHAQAQRSNKVHMKWKFSPFVLYRVIFLSKGLNNN